jgi:hypothetical protein
MQMIVQESLDSFHTLDLGVEAFWLYKRTASADIVVVDTQNMCC